jgi:hypothetical protein
MVLRDLGAVADPGAGIEAGEDGADGGADLAGVLLVVGHDFSVLSQSVLEEWQD